jgi:hypothetical protein
MNIVCYRIYYEASSRHIVSCDEFNILIAAHCYFSGLLAIFFDGFSDYATLVAVRKTEPIVTCLQPADINSSQRVTFEPQKEDLFRRVFWTCHILERYIAS